MHCRRRVYRFRTQPSATWRALNAGVRARRYWQYKSGTRGAVATTRQPVSLDALHSYKPFGLIIAALCESSAPDQLVCSAETAARRLEPWQQSPWLPLLKGPVGLHTWAAGLAALVLGWGRAMLLTLTRLIISMPMTYAVTNL